MIGRKLVRDGSLAICVFDGELDLYSAPQMEVELLEALDQPGPVIVDLSKCTYLDSTILTVLIRLTAQFRERFCLVVPTESKIWRILQITRLADELPIELDIDIARRRWDVAESP